MKMFNILFISLTCYPPIHIQTPQIHALIAFIPGSDLKNHFFDCFSSVYIAFGGSPAKYRETAIFLIFSSIFIYLLK